MVRPPAVAGKFYPDDPDRLRADVESFLDHTAPRRQALAILCPHAGYDYSGITAGKAFSRVEVPRQMILLGVNHFGIGKPYAVFSEGQWLTPLGPLDIDKTLADKLL